MPRVLQRLLWFVLGLATLTNAKAADGFIVGVGTHLLNGAGSLVKPLKMVEQAGIRSIRDDAFWSMAEPEPGFLHIPPAWQRYLAALRARQLSNVLILGYGNTFHGNNAKPDVPLVGQAFAHYVDFVSRELRGSVDHYEIWNEWDQEDASDPAVSDAYARVVKDTARRLRGNDPKAKILAGAVTSQGLEAGFAERLIKAGVLGQVDGLSLHPYVYCRKALSGNTPESWIKWLNAQGQRLNNLAGHRVPLYLTEMGWPSSDEPCGISEATQAAFLARSFFLARINPDIHGMWWYDLFDDGRDAESRDHNFGLLDNDLKQKPAYATLKSIVPVLTEYRYEPEKSLLADNLYQLHFSKGDEHVVVAWVIGRARQAKIESSGSLQGPVQRLDTREPQQGQTDSESQWECSEHRCTAVVMLNEFPQIISLGNADWLFTR